MARADLYQKQKNWDLALADYNKIIQINPKYAKAYANRGIVMFKKGNKKKAILDLQKAAQLLKSQKNTAHYEEVINKIQELQK